MPFEMGKIGEFREPPYVPTVCPRCLGTLPVGYPGALSRVDNETEICSECGTDEAIIQYMDGFLIEIERWPVRKKSTIADLVVQP